MNDPNKAITLENTRSLTVYYNEVRAELNDILAYWISNSQDPVNGGFIGRIDENNIAYPDSPKGAVLNARILWAFSAGYKLTNELNHFHQAKIAFTYLTSHFVDKQYGGIYWTVSAQGQPLETKKQIYALAFAIYGCSAYFEISNNESAKYLAIELYRQIEAHSFDTKHTGYLEAFGRDWQPLEDLRLSSKDANEKKTMNTHLHILEAYTSLYRIWPDEELKTQIKNLLQNFRDHFVDDDTGHLVLFFDEKWNGKRDTISFGHDIEAAWLLLEAAAVIEDPSLLEDIKKISVKMAVAASEGLDSDGGLWYEFEMNASHIIKEKHWWVQAEAMVGFFNHWQSTKDETYLQSSLQSWQFINTYIKDKIYGEWFWGINDNGTVMKGQDKVGIWKCPYHNSRACIEIINRLGPILPK